jgi:hypothetical protein
MRFGSADSVTSLRRWSYRIYPNDERVKLSFEFEAKYGKDFNIRRVIMLLLCFH